MRCLFGRVMVSEKPSPCRMVRSPERRQPVQERFQIVPWPWNGPVLCETEQVHREATVGTKREEQGDLSRRSILGEQRIIPQGGAFGRTGYRATVPVKVRPRAAKECHDSGHGSGTVTVPIIGVSLVSAYSDPFRPLIPTQVGHPFRRNPATILSSLGIGGRHPSEWGRRSAASGSARIATQVLLNLRYRAPSILNGRSSRCQRSE
jgi:hypothetical protein